MTKKNLTAEVTVRVLGKELTKAEAEELYAALGSALGKSPFTFVPGVPYYRPMWNADLIGTQVRSPSDAADPYRINYAATNTSAMVEKIIN